MEIRITGRLLRIARLDAELYHYLTDPAPMIEQLRNLAEHIDLFTFLQGVPETKPKFGYPMEWDNLAVLPISTFENWWSEQINPKTRNRARLAEKRGAVVREVEFDDDLVRGIWRYITRPRSARVGLFPHYGKDLDRVYNDTATYIGYSIFIGAFQGEELIGFIKLVTDQSGLQCGVMNILSKMAHKDKSPTNALLAQAVRSCADRGISNLVYANYGYGNKNQDSLSDFKERNGFKRVDIPRYYVPLTGIGAIALHLGLHHRLIDRFPESVVGKLRGLRKMVYNRGIQSPKEVV